MLEFESRTARESGGTEISLDKYTAVLRRHRWWILLAIVLGLVLGLAYALRRPRVFEARSTLIVSSSKIGVDPAGTVPSDQGFRAFLVNQTLIAQVLSETGLDRPPHSLTPAAFERGHLIVEDVVPASLMRVRVRLSDPSLAAQACNRLVALAIDLNHRVNAEERTTVQEFIRAQLDRTRDRLRSLQTALLEFKARAQLDLRRKEVDALLAQRSDLLDLDVRLAAERGRLAAATTELMGRPRILPAAREPNRIAAVAELEPTDRPIPNRPHDSPPANRDASAAMPDATVAQEPGADSGTASDTRGRPREADVETDAQSARARALLAGRSDGFIDPVYEILDYEAASSRVRIAELESRRREMVGGLGLTAPTLKPLTDFYARELEQARLESEYALVSKVYDDLFERYEQARIQVASRSTELKLIDKALAPTQLSIPSVPVTAALGAMAGLGCGILGAFLFEFLRRPVIRDVPETRVAR